MWLDLYPHISKYLTPPAPNVISVTVPFFAQAGTSWLISSHLPWISLCSFDFCFWSRSKALARYFPVRITSAGTPLRKKKNLIKHSKIKPHIVWLYLNLFKGQLIFRWLKPLNWTRADMHHYSILSSFPWMPLISICPSPVCLCSFTPSFKVDCKAFGTVISGVSANGKDRLTPSSCPVCAVGSGWTLERRQQEWANLVNG